MKAIVLNEAGGADKLIYQDIEKPVLKNGEILVRTKNIGMNPMDVHIRGNEQILTRFMGSERPAILGWDISGEVVEKADDITDFEIGDAVFGLTKGKGYAEYVAVKTDLMVHKPANISYAEAAAVPVVGITAWEALIKIGNVKKGDRVLIHAASGGVGYMAIQLAKHLGATVIATSSGKNRDFVLSLGADQHIDYTTEKFYEVVKDVDFVLDPIGGETRMRSIDVVKKNGTIVSVVPIQYEEAQEKAREKGVNLIILLGQGNKEEMESLAGLLRKGILKVHISAVYPFSQMANAHLQIESKRTVGKIVVEL
ncbi:NADPH:quinone reductase-like Zn-dependent oxidoreductase [Mucilaginibacter frigoritolerans]|uniref:NADPH:quinone reductase-like Zn-dependent oxidoreductase n=1 Tax=Mucilaginibacter frigoritolerans TaxID=652788 RepID=A0A562UDI0_9SPHI|nr:NADP-dependent oxidoreductase [Mucilaginibacter frigoritolerans]TWJ03355.1 NADPH:quinone reductase-like Zn-dependent oxidoreductase [Mucilaginibacter frigoritolerans]